jgi:hypothetical protein
MELWYIHLKMRTGKEGDTKRKKEAKTSNSFDKALASMIKTLNACHFDPALKEQSLYCEPLMNQMPNFLLKLCFGFHYGSAIEGMHPIVERVRTEFVPILNLKVQL